MVQKILIALFLLLGSSCALEVGTWDRIAEGIAGFSELPALDSKTQASLGRLFSLTAFKYLENLKLENNGGGRVPIFPPFEQDAIPLESVSLRISSDSGIAPLIYGDIDFCDVILSGLTSITNDFDLDAFMAELPDGVGEIRLKLKTGSNFTIDGKQDLNVTLLSVSSLFPGGIHHNSETDPFFFRLHNVELHLNIRIENFLEKFNVTKVEIVPIIYDRQDDTIGIAFNFGYGWINLPDETEMTDENWANFSGLISQVLSLLWNGIAPSINGNLTQIAHNMLKECTIVHLIAGDASCVGREAEEEGAGLDEMIRSTLSEFITISSSDGCPAETSTPEPSPSPPTPTTPPVATTEVEVSPPPTTPPGGEGPEDPNPDPVQIINNVFVLKDVNFTNVNFTLNIDS